MISDVPKFTRFMFGKNDVWQPLYKYRGFAELAKHTILPPFTTGKPDVCRVCQSGGFAKPSKLPNISSRVNARMMGKGVLR